MRSLGGETRTGWSRRMALGPGARDGKEAGVGQE